MADTIDKMTGLVWTDEGKVLGRKNWEVECEIDLRLVRNVVVKAATQEEAEEKARELWERKYSNQNPYVEITSCWSPD
jgi:hypothetical protein|tara:strand:- start:735 stop:968 length:234 start_codon:yes stop_codon:yes gene_type:complete